MLLTCCTEQYLGARRVWREYAACRYLHTQRGPMITCNPPSAGETQRVVCQVWLLHIFSRPGNFQLHASLSEEYDWNTIIESVCSTLREEEWIWFNSSSGKRTFNKIQPDWEYMTLSITLTWVSQRFVVMICSLSCWKCTSEVEITFKIIYTLVAQQNFLICQRKAQVDLINSNDGCVLLSVSDSGLFNLYKQIPAYDCRICKQGASIFALEAVVLTIHVWVGIHCRDPCEEQK